MSARIIRIGVPILLGLVVGLFVWIGRESETALPAKALASPTKETAGVPKSAPVAIVTPTRVAEPRLEEADVKTRQQYYDGLVVQPPLVLLSRFLNAADSDETTRAILLQAFTTSLADKGRDAGLSRPFAEALLDPAFSLETKEMLAQALAESATLGGLLALLQVAEDQTAPPELRSVLHEAISTVGGKRRDDGSFPTDLSPPLEAVFLRAALNPQANPELVSATSLAIAQVGSENGVRVLLQKIATLPLTAETVARVRNAAAIPALLEPLRASANYSDPRMEAAGEALIHIGGEAATRPALEWVKNAPDQAEPLVARWFANIREPVSYELVGRYLSSERFRSSAIQSALEKAYEANTPEPIPRDR